jgi:hypothetical protein
MRFLLLAVMVAVVGCGQGTPAKDGSAAGGTGGAGARDGAARGDTPAGAGGAPADGGRPDGAGAVDASATGGAPGQDGPGGGAGGGGASGGGGAGGRIDGGAGDQASCGVQNIVLPRQVPEILMLLDRSASMQNDVNDMTPTGSSDPSKWSLVVPALTQVVSSTGSSVSWGSKLFPEEGPECGNGTVTNAISVPIAAANTSPVNQAILAATPAGNGTPTAAAVDAAVAYLATRTTSNPKYLLLVTDGEPGCAGTVGMLTKNTDQARIDAVGRVTAAASAGIHTFVVGVATNLSSETQTLNSLAVAGLEPRPDQNPLATRYYLAETKDDLVAAIQAVATRAQSCVLPLSAAPTAPDDVALALGSATVPRDPTGTDGWNYTGADHTVIQLFGSWCEMLKSAGAPSAQLTLGCGAGTDGGVAKDAGSQTLLFSDDFEDGDAQGWIATANGSATWAVALDGTNHVLQGTTTISALDWIAAGDVRWTDQLMEATVKITSVPDPTCRLVMAARFVGVTDYTFIDMTGDGRLRTRETVAGSTTNLASSYNLGAPLAAGNVYRLGLAIKGTAVTASLNGTAVATGTQVVSTAANGGIAFGLDCIGASFDDVRVTLP